MPLLQFQPLSSQPTPSFWSALNSLKLDKLKLDDSQQPIEGWYETGKEVVDRGAGPSDAASRMIGVDGSLSVGGGAFGEEGEHPSSNSIPVRGIFKNFNTIEEFRSTEPKKELFDQVVASILASFRTESPIFNPFLLVTFADLKKYVYHYWFAFPALVAKPGWEVGDEGLQVVEEKDTDELERMADEQCSPRSRQEAFLMTGTRGQRKAHPLTGASGLGEEEITLVFFDPSALPDNPGWPLRNILYYLHAVHHITQLRIICLRQGAASRFGYLSLPSSTTSSDERPQAVGWERNKAGKLASRVADLGPMLDPARLADQAVDLNLKLMRWRIMPSLQLEKIAATRCLLLGAGTLGCYVSRALMGWGIRTITFVDSARVSYSNPVRQPLFDFEDCLDGGKPKAQCAADRLKKIFPGVASNASAHEFMIPMPGHPVAPTSLQTIRADVEKLESLIAAHDVVFLLMDSRESRWLPTVIGASRGKIVINAALGFDSYLVMRHGAGPDASRKGRLGCYFCNDVVAPADSLSDRTLDQMCTVTRPGIAPIASASAVELLVSLIQHPQGINAPAETAASVEQRDAAEISPLGAVPHQLRGQLGAWRTLLVEGTAYDKCTGCSQVVVDAYRTHGFEMLLRAFNETDYLEKLTGLDVLQKECEAILDDLDWDEGSESSL